MYYSTVSSQLLTKMTRTLNNYAIKGYTTLQVKIQLEHVLENIYARVVCVSDK